MAFSPGGLRVASASVDGRVKVWDTATGEQTLTLKGHTSLVQSVAFSPDGSRLASPSNDNSVKVWNTATGQETLTLKGHTGQVFGVAFSPDGTRLASASQDRTVKVWDAVNGQETLTLKGHTRAVLVVAFSPDGTRLASASQDRTVRTWDARDVTPESFVRDEARGVILFLIDRLATEADLRALIAGDKARSPLVREAALDMVRGYWTLRIRSRAEAIVGDLFVRLLLRDDVLAALQSQPMADPEIQAACLKLACTWPESPGACSKASWDLVRDSRRQQTVYQRGLCLAKSACRLRPDNGFYLNDPGRRPVPRRFNSRGEGDPDAVIRLERGDTTCRPGLPGHGPPAPGPPRGGPRHARPATQRDAPG